MEYAMNNAAKSVFAWGIYMLGVGAIFLLAPNLALPIFGFSITGEIWTRLAAVLAIALGCYYILAARHNFVPLFVWKVYLHAFGVVCMLAFVLLRLAPPAMLAFAAADLLAGIWTALALRGSRLAPARAV
jgi:hypothetical protein